MQQQYKTSSSIAKFKTLYKLKYKEYQLENKMKSFYARTVIPKINLHGIKQKADDIKTNAPKPKQEYRPHSVKQRDLVRKTLAQKNFLSIPFDHVIKHFTHVFSTKTLIFQFLKRNNCS